VAKSAFSIISFVFFDNFSKTISKQFLKKFQPIFLARRKKNLWKTKNPKLTKTELKKFSTFFKSFRNFFSKNCFEMGFENFRSTLRISFVLTGKSPFNTHTNVQGRKLLVEPV
jgi:hypothetical protein